MNHLLRRITRRKSTDRGASAVEYGLLIAGIAAIIVVAVFALGPVVTEIFADTCDSVKAEAGASLTATCDS
jgi:pilus assembly protein Flp/PilA